MDTGQQIADALGRLTHTAAIHILVIAAVAWMLFILAGKLAPWAIQRLPTTTRLRILPLVPVLRLVIIMAAMALIVPHVMSPTRANIFALIGGLALFLGFAFKDYLSGLIAGVLALIEQPYRSGDWVTIDGTLGEIRSVGLRTFTMVTPDDTAVVVPHSRIWNTLIFNENNGSPTLMCVAQFYLDPRHDTARVREKLRDVAITSPYVDLAHPVVVIVAERPGYTLYRLKAYPIDMRDQFQFTSDLTARAKALLEQMGVHAANMPIATTASSAH